VYRQYWLATAGVIALGACSDSSRESSSSTTTLSPNTAPVVDAGPDLAGMETTIVEIDATVSGSGVTIEWSQIAGPPVQFNSTSIEDPTVILPKVGGDTTATLRVTVSDNVNDPVTDDVTITIANASRKGPSSQGIDDNSDDRRDKAKRDRDGDRPRSESREVRTYNGSNNNVANPLWGASFVHLQRLAPSDYEDDIGTMAGGLRPSAREVSNTIAAQDAGVSIENAANATDFVWQWGQFIDHDLDLTDGGEEVADIAVPTGDAWFDPDGIGASVIFFNRAVYDPDTGTDTANPREQENEITGWLDGSMIYGSDDERAAALRVAPDSPFLATSAGNLLPFNTDDLTNANGFVPDPASLFLAGDVRANEQVGLTVMHTLFVREHNRLAALLQERNPGADAEAIFQKARRLVIAELQIITYEEFLPALIGPDALPPYTGYDATINPSIYNEFSVAAYRLGHSMLNEALLRLDAGGAEIAAGHLALREAFFTAPSILQAEGDLDPILRGLARQLHQRVDTRIVDDVRNFLFGQPGVGGLDLASLNIQRGRDHGVPGYNDVREAMGLSRIASFAEITSDADLAQALADTYFNVDGIDLWIGGLAEDPLVSESSQLGPLFTAIIARQFRELRDGDRFWYQNDLSTDEREMVRGTTLSAVIRANTGIGNELQANVFILN